MNSKQRNALNKAYKRQQELCEFMRKERETERKKSELISSLRSVLLELSKERAEIQSSIDSNIKSHTELLEVKMRDFVINFQELEFIFQMIYVKNLIE